jgi:hypothetical protein
MSRYKKLSKDYAILPIMFFEFDMERFQSLYENEVDFNLSDSGVHPLTINDLLNEEEMQDFLNMEIGYGYSQGDPALRDNISTWYRNKNRSNILITNGSAEANFLTAWSLLNPGDEVIMMLPNYMQVPGLAKIIGTNIKYIYLKEENNWHLDLNELRSLLTNQTKLISICNPNNPTGAVMSDKEMKELADLAQEFDVYVHSDEVYRGSELDGDETKSFNEFYDKTIVSCGLSKSFAHPGLRIGWLVADSDLIAELWAHKDYSSICASVLSQEIAKKIMASETRKKILSRSNTMLSANLQLFQDWLGSHPGLFSFVPPHAGGMAFVGYQMNINSTELAHKLRTDQSVLIVPGDCYGMDKYLRFGIGSPSDYLSQGLNLVSKCIHQIGY